MRAVSGTALVLAMVIVYVALTQALTSPELTARYRAKQQTEQVQAQQQGETARRWAATWETWGMWGLPAAAVVGGAALAGWTVVQWQRERTKRAVVYEEQTTARHLITAKKDIVLAYLVQFGEPGAQPMVLNGVRGAYLPSSNEFVPEDVCRAELAQRPMLTVSTQQEDW